ncbi:MAG: ROK family protein [Clostridiaceae bacterium]|nr:ROK family protein [Clostridiaceae bacterium]
MIRDVIDIKNKNAKIITDLIRFDDTLTKRDISVKTGLSITTVSNICAELAQIGIVSNKKTINSRVGRNPVRVTFVHQNFLVVCIDFQILNVMKLAISTVRNQIIYSETYDISTIDQPEELAAFAKSVFDTVSECYDREVHFIGVGIAVPAIYDRFDGKLISSSIDLFANVPLKEIFQKYFDIPVFIDNSSNFKAVSALTTTKLDNIVCLDISLGVGTGIVCNGSLLRGKNGYGAEVAHIPIGDMSLQCPTCGAYGCVETELLLERLLTYFPNRDVRKPLYDQWSDFVQYIYENQEKYEVLLTRIGTLVGKLVLILTNLFDPSLFIITGYIVDVFELIDKRVMEVARKQCDMAIKRGLTFQVESYYQSNIFTGICDTMYEKWMPLEDVPNVR